MNKLFLLATMLVYCCVTRADAQELFVNGQLRSLTDSSIVIINRYELADTKKIVLQRTSQTTIVGCRESDIKLGAEVTASYTENQGEGKIASTITFTTCSPFLFAYGKVVATSENSITVKNESIDSWFRINQEVVFEITDTSQLVSCTQTPISTSDIGIGTLVYVSGIESQNGEYNAIYAQTSNDCPISTYITATVTGKSDTSLFVTADGFGNLEALVPINQDLGGIRDINLLGITDCIGQYYSWDAIDVGTEISAAVTIYPETGIADLSTLTVRKGCPPDSLFPENSIFGGFAKVVKIEDDEFVLNLQLKGVITAKVTENTLFSNCVGLPIDRSVIVEGADIIVTVSRTKDGYFLRQVVNKNGCDLLRIEAVIESANESSAIIRLESGNALDVQTSSETKVIDCSNRNRMLSDSVFVEANASVVLDISTDPPTLLFVQANVECPTVQSALVKIVAVSDSTIDLELNGNIKSVERNKIYLASIDGNVTAITEDKVGTVGCAVLSDIDGRILYAYIVEQTNCDGEPISNTIKVRGIVTNRTSQTVAISTADGTREFSLTERTQVIGDGTLFSLRNGESISITSTERGKGLEPIASLIEIIKSTTSIQDLPNETNTLRVIPNPASDVVSITNTNVRSADLYTLSGELVQTFPASLLLDLRGISNATYLVKVQMNDGSTHCSLLHIIR